MPSEKRQRQRERRQVKVAAEQVRAKRNRRLRAIVGAIVVAGLVVGLIALFSNKTPKKVATGKTTTTTVAPSTTTTTTPVAVAPTCPPVTESKVRETAFTKAPPICISPTGVYDATFTTDVGPFVVQMNAASSLAAVNDIVFLARYRFFDGTIFHRVIPSFVVQGGSPNGTGNGGPGYSFTGNLPASSCTAKGDCYATGDLALANSSGPSSDGSQFFVVLPGGAAGLTDNYTLVGKVISGMSVVEKIGADGSASGTPKVTHTLKTVTITQVP